MIYYLDPWTVMKYRNQYGQFESGIDLFAIHFQVESRGYIEEIENQNLWDSLLTSLPYKLSKEDIYQLRFIRKLDIEYQLSDQITQYPIIQRSIVEQLDSSQLNEDEQQFMQQLQLWEDEYLCLRSLILQMITSQEMLKLINKINKLQKNYYNIIQKLILRYFVNLHFPLNFIKLQIPQMEIFKQNIQQLSIGIIGNNWRNRLIIKYLCSLDLKDVIHFKSVDEHPFYYSPIYVQNEKYLKFIEENDKLFKQYKPLLSTQIIHLIKNILEKSDSQYAFFDIFNEIELFMIQNGLTKYTSVKHLQNFLFSTQPNHPIIFNTYEKINHFIRDINTIKKIITTDNFVHIECTSKKFQFNYLIFGDSCQFVDSIIKKTDTKDNPGFDMNFCLDMRKVLNDLEIRYITKAICKFKEQFWDANFVKYMEYDSSPIIIYDFGNNSLMIVLYKQYSEIAKCYEYHKKEIIKMLQQEFGDNIVRQNTLSIRTFSCEYFDCREEIINKINQIGRVYFNIPILYGNGNNLLTQTIIDSLNIIREILRSTLDNNYQNQLNQKLNEPENCFGIQYLKNSNVKINEDLPIQFKPQNYILNKGFNNSNFVSIINIQYQDFNVNYFFTILEDDLQRKIYAAIPEDNQSKIYFHYSLFQLHQLLKNRENLFLIKDITNNDQEENIFFKFPNIYPQLLLDGKIDDLATNILLSRTSQYELGSLFIGINHPILKLLTKIQSNNSSVVLPQFFQEYLKYPLIKGKFRLTLFISNDQIILKRRFMSINSFEFQDYTIQLSGTTILIQELNIQTDSTEEIWNQMYQLYLNNYNMKHFCSLMNEFISQEVRIIDQFDKLNQIIEQQSQNKIIPKLNISNSETLYASMKQNDTFEIINGKLLYCIKK